MPRLNLCCLKPQKVILLSVVYEEQTISYLLIISHRTENKQKHNFSIKQFSRLFSKEVNHLGSLTYLLGISRAKIV
jgi:hypothetical protein